MPAILKVPPPSDAYRFVLRRYNIAPRNEQIFRGYDETVRSRACELNGVVAQTLFIRRPNTMKRALRMGWKDETKAWNEQLSMADDDLTENERLIYMALLNAKKPIGKQEILLAAGLDLFLDKTRFRNLIVALKKLGKIEQSGRGKNTKYEVID